jgi:hypothetical protein
MFLVNKVNLKITSSGIGKCSDIQGSKRKLENISVFINLVVKSKKVRWMGHITCTEVLRNI